MSAPSAAPQPLRVLVVDDSALRRQTLGRMVAAEPDLRLVGTASHGLEALPQMRRLDPDVVTLDIEMPGLDGLTALRRIMADCPRPVVTVSSLTRPTAAATVTVLLRGAVAVAAKPSGPAPADIANLRDDLLRKIRGASRGAVIRWTRGPPAGPPAAWGRAQNPGPR